MPIDLLDSLVRNPHRGDVEAVMKSYERFGQRKPIVARHTAGGRGEVTAGNTQLAAAKELRWSEIAVVWADDDDSTARAWALADNRTAELGFYDEEALLDYLQSVALDSDELFAATGYTAGDLERLLKRTGGPDDFKDLDPDQLEVEYRCPSCGYEWSGSTAPGGIPDSTEG
jgi:ParB-like chromosome segregation protein Spo0J